MSWTRNPGTFWGGVLVILGILFLLANTGVLDNAGWDVIWPVFLIAAGVWLIVARIGPGGALAGVDGSESLDGLPKAKLEIAVGAGRLEVRTAPLGDRLYQLHIDHAGSAPEVRLDRATGTLRISQPLGWLTGSRRMRVEAQLSDSIPWDLSCSTGAIRGDFDLSSATLSGFECKTGASRIDLRLPAPKGQVPIRVDGGALTVDLTRPAASAVRVLVSAGAVHLKADGVRQDGIGSREWRSSGYDNAADRYEVSVAGGATDVTVDGS